MNTPTVLDKPMRFTATGTRVGYRVTDRDDPHFVMTFTGPSAEAEAEDYAELRNGAI